MLSLILSRALHANGHHHNLLPQPLALYMIHRSAPSFREMLCYSAIWIVSFLTFREVVFIKLWHFLYLLQEDHDKPQAAQSLTLDDSLHLHVLLEKNTTKPVQTECSYWWTVFLNICRNVTLEWLGEKIIQNSRRHWRTDSLIVGEVYTGICDWRKRR